MGTGIKMGGGGAIKVLNGILEKYYAFSTDISANSFIEFIENSPLLSKQYTADTLSGSMATIIDDSRILLSVKTQGSKCLFRVLKLENDSWSFGTEVSISSKRATSISCLVPPVVLDADRIFVYLYPYSTSRTTVYSSSAYLLTLDDMTITITTLSSSIDSQAGNTGAYVHSHLSSSTCIKLDSNRVLCICTYFIDSHSSWYLQAYVATISGTSITFGDKLSVLATSYGSYNFPYRSCNLIELDSNKVFLSCSAISSTNAYNHYGIVLTINDTTISKGTTTVIVTAYRETLVTRKLNNNKIFAAYILSSGAGDLTGRIINISDTTITTDSSPSTFPANTSIDNWGDIVIIDNNNGYIFNSIGSGITSMITPFSVDSNDIITFKDKLTMPLSPYVIKPALIDELNIILISGQENSSTAAPYNVYYIKLGKYIKLASSKIDGLLINKATTKTIGKVYTLA